MREWETLRGWGYVALRRGRCAQLMRACVGGREENCVGWWMKIEVCVRENLFVDRCVI